MDLIRRISVIRQHFLFPDHISLDRVRGLVSGNTWRSKEFTLDRIQECFLAAMLVESKTMFDIWEFTSGDQGLSCINDKCHELEFHDKWTKKISSRSCCSCSKKLVQKGAFAWLHRVTNDGRHFSPNSEVHFWSAAFLFFTTQCPLVSAVATWWWSTSRFFLTKAAQSRGKGTSRRVTFPSPSSSKNMLQL